jgi:hypothetical protein
VSGSGGSFASSCRCGHTADRVNGIVSATIGSKRPCTCGSWGYRWRLIRQFLLAGLLCKTLLRQLCYTVHGGPTANGPWPSGQWAIVLHHCVATHSPAPVLVGAAAVHNSNAGSGTANGSAMVGDSSRCQQWQRTRQTLQVRLLPHKLQGSTTAACLIVSHCMCPPR